MNSSPNLPGVGSQLYETNPQNAAQPNQQNKPNFTKNETNIPQITQITPSLSTQSTHHKPQPSPQLGLKQSTPVVKNVNTAKTSSLFLSPILQQSTPTLPGNANTPKAHNPKTNGFQNEKSDGKRVKTNENQHNGKTVWINDLESQLDDIMISFTEISQKSPMLSTSMEEEQQKTLIKNQNIRNNNKPLQSQQFTTPQILPSQKLHIQQQQQQQQQIYQSHTLCSQPKHSQHINNSLTPPQTNPHTNPPQPAKPQLRLPPTPVITSIKPNNDPKNTQKRNHNLPKESLNTPLREPISPKRALFQRPELGTIKSPHKPSNIIGMTKRMKSSVANSRVPTPLPDGDTDGMGGLEVSGKEMRSTVKPALKQRNEQYETHTRAEEIVINRPVIRHKPSQSVAKVDNSKRYNREKDQLEIELENKRQNFAKMIQEQKLQKKEQAKKIQNDDEKTNIKLVQPSPSRKGSSNLVGIEASHKITEVRVKPPRIIREKRQPLDVVSLRAQFREQQKQLNSTVGDLFDNDDDNVPMSFSFDIGRKTEPNIEKIEKPTTSPPNPPHSQNPSKLPNECDKHDNNDDDNDEDDEINDNVCLSFSTFHQSPHNSHSPSPEPTFKTPMKIYPNQQHIDSTQYQSMPSMKKDTHKTPTKRPTLSSQLSFRSPFMTPNTRTKKISAGVGDGGHGYVIHVSKRFLQQQQQNRDKLQHVQKSPYRSNFDSFDQVLCKDGGDNNFDKVGGDSAGCFGTNGFKSRQSNTKPSKPAYNSLYVEPYDTEEYYNHGGNQGSADDCDNFCIENEVEARLQQPPPPPPPPTLALPRTPLSKQGHLHPNLLKIERRRREMMWKKEEREQKRAEERSRREHHE